MTRSVPTAKKQDISYAFRCSPVIIHNFTCVTENCNRNPGSLVAKLEFIVSALQRENGIWRKMTIQGHVWSVEI